MDKHVFGSKDFTIERRETLFSGFFRVVKYYLRHRKFDGGWTPLLQRELFRRGDAVGVLLYDPVNHLVGLVEQFRIGALNEPHGPWQYELVAGMLEAGETPEQVAVRELQEEAGIEVEKLLPICDYLVSAGGTDEKMYLFCGLCDLQGKGGLFGLEDESEDIKFHVWDYNKAMEAHQSGSLNSAAATIGMLWLQLNYDRLGKQLKLKNAAQTD
jgi:ADP-ribose pyrophosphatase